MPANLSTLLVALEKDLMAALEQSKTFIHPGSRGDVVEKAIRQVLDDHLPRYLTVGTGEAIDTSDTRSGQIDVVIANQDQPIRRERDGASIFLIEGIAAAGEVKSRLTTHELRRAIDGATKFKRLRNMHLKGDQIMVNPSDLRRFYECPPYFLVAFQTAVATETLIQTLLAANPVTGPDGTGEPLSPLDAVFVLGAGCAINYGDGKGALSFEYTAGPLAGQRSTGWAWHPSSQTLVELLLWLNATMPRVLRYHSIATQYLIEQLPPRQAQPWPSPEASPREQ